MADNTLIEWTDATWNPITGCSVVSPGCTNCYAMRLAGTRLKNHPSRHGLTVETKAGPVWNGKVKLNMEWLDQPIRWRRSRRVFVCAHGDLFAEGVPDSWIDRVFAVMMLAPQHTYQVLTKRPDRMRAYFQGDSNPDLISGRSSTSVIQRIQGHAVEYLKTGQFAPNGFGPHYGADYRRFIDQLRPLPLSNVWLGISAEDQKRLDQRIDDLRWTPAAVRFVSAEPLIGPLDFTRTNNVSTIALDALRGIRVDPESGMPFPGDEPVGKIDWIIVGGESGPGSRAMHPEWARSIRDQCAGAGTALFFKQWGEWVAEDQAPARTEWPETTPAHYFPGDPDPVWRVGKKWSGRDLDGVEHNAMPAVL